MSVCDSEGEQGILSLLTAAKQSLGNIRNKPQQLENILASLTSAEIQIEEAVADLRSFQEQFDVNPDRLAELNQRLGQIHKVARKHNVAPRDLLDLLNSLRSQLDGFKNSSNELDRLIENDKLLREQYALISKQVTKQRLEGAKQLSLKINEQLHKLNMQHAKLEICCLEKNDENPTAGGRESVEILVSTNPGAKPEALAKIASGGELSRISLAIQVITAQTSQIASLVFDEVDVGIGGGVAKNIGGLLRNLGERAQILCVTHQAQVASQGHHHFSVTKESNESSSLTRINELRGEAVVTEIARMLGGDNFTDESLAHAEQMIISN